MPSSDFTGFNAEAPWFHPRPKAELAEVELDAMEQEMIRLQSETEKPSKIKMAEKKPEKKVDKRAEKKKAAEEFRSRAVETSDEVRPATKAYAGNNLLRCLSENVNPFEYGHPIQVFEEPAGLHAATLQFGYKYLVAGGKRFKAVETVAQPAVEGTKDAEMLLLSTAPEVAAPAISPLEKGGALILLQLGTDSPTATLPVFLCQEGRGRSLLATAFFHVGRLIGYHGCAGSLYGLVLSAYADIAEKVGEGLIDLRELQWLLTMTAADIGLFLDPGDLPSPEDGAEPSCYRSQSGRIEIGPPEKPSYDHLSSKQKEGVTGALQGLGKTVPFLNLKDLVHYGLELANVFSLKVGRDLAAQAIPADLISAPSKEASINHTLSRGP